MSAELTTTEATTARAMAIPSHLAGLLDPGRFEHLQRVANAFAKSSLVPQQFQGNLANCFIGLQLAMRLEIDPFMLFQGLSVIHGRPNMEAKLMIALLNSSGKIRGTVRYEFDGDGDAHGCTAVVTDAATGNEVRGPKVDWTLVKAEGWDKPKGQQVSKWKTMPRLMFHYRAASYLIRTHYPEVTMGLLTREEVEDMTIDAEFHAAKPAATAGIKYASRSEAIAAQLDAAKQEEAEAVQPEPLDDGSQLTDDAADGVDVPQDEPPFEPTTRSRAEEYECRIGVATDAGDGGAALRGLEKEIKADTELTTDERKMLGSLIVKALPKAK